MFFRLLLNAREFLRRVHHVHRFFNEIKFLGSLKVLVSGAHPTVMRFQAA